MSYLFDIFIAEGLVALRIRELLYVFQMLLDREIAPVQLLYLGKHLPHQLLPEGDQLLGLVGQILELIDNLGFQIENRTLQSHLVGGSFSLVHAEEFEVSAEVEDVEFFLILAVHQSRAQPGAPSYHLPELGLAHHLFEEYQVQHLRHIDAGVQHVYGDGDLRQLFRVGELVDGALSVGHVVVDDLGVARQMRILLAEHLQDLLSMTVVLGEDDGLAQLLPVVDFHPVGHQQIQGQLDGILVEEPLVEGGGLDPLRQLPVFVGEGSLVFCLFLLRQIVVGDALLQEFQLALHREEVHQEAVLYRLGELIAVGGHAALQLKDLVGILVDLILGGSSKAHQRSVEVVEDVPVFVID